MKESKGFFEVLCAMTWKERVEHIWDNYKMWLLVIVLLIVWVLNTVLTPRMEKPETVNGITINLALTEEGETALTSTWLEGVEKTGKLYTVNFSDETAAADFDNHYNQVLKMPMLVGAKELDYILASREGLEQYIVQDIYMDLRQLLSQAEIDEMIKQIIHCTPLDSSGNPTKEGNIPVAIDITELPFAKEHIRCDGQVFLAFAGNAPNKEQMVQLWNYISQWKN